MKTPKKPLYLKFEIDGYQEDQIVGHSLAESYKRIKSDRDTHQFLEDRDALLKALRLVCHYYTGRVLK